LETPLYFIGYLNPCRASVIEQDILRGNYADDWYFPKMLRMSPLVVRANQQACSDFCATLNFTRDRQFTQPAQQHDVCEDVPLRNVIENLLLNYRVEDSDDTESTLGMLLQLSYALRRNPDETARVYRMRPDFPDAERGLDGNGKISSIRRLLQGPTRSGTGYSYPGDYEFRDNDQVTVQIHSINLTDEGRVVLSAVPAIAIWIPDRMDLDWVVQDQQARTANAAGA
jgi:hypothetical protein